MQGACQFCLREFWKIKADVIRREAAHHPGSGHTQERDGAADRSSEDLAVEDFARPLLLQSQISGGVGELLRCAGGEHAAVTHEREKPTAPDAAQPGDAM